MAVTIAGTQLKAMTFDGQTVKKWIHDGVQVFSAATQFYPGKTPTVLNQSSVGSYTATSTTWQCSVPNGTNYNSTVTYLAMDLTNVKTLTIEGSSSGGLAGYYLVSQAQMNSYGGNYGLLWYPYYVFYQPNESIYTNKGTSLPVTINVASYSGTYYLCLGCYSNSSGNQSAQITAVKGE